MFDKRNHSRTINDDHANINLICSFLDAYPGIRDVHILPYHDFQKSKYAKLGISYNKNAIFAPVPERLDQFQKQLKDRGIRVSLGG